MLRIFLFAAISRLTGIFLFLQILNKSLSLICLLSSLKCIVTELAPYLIASLAASKGSG